MKTTDKNISIEIGSNIRALRHKSQLNQGQVADKLGISIPAYSKIETGITDPNISRLVQIADCFGVHLDIVLYGDQPSEELGEVLDLKEKLAQRDSEIIKLQAKLIGLYDEVRN